MKTITPSECIARIELFNSRVKRLQENKYTLPRSRTQDLNALCFDMKGLMYWCSIAIFNKNTARAQKIIDQANDNWLVADKLRSDYLFERQEKERFNLNQKGSYVSRSVYQQTKEENKKLLADIKILVLGNLDPFLDTHIKWKKHFNRLNEQNELIKRVCAEMILENSDNYPTYLVEKAKQNINS